MWFALYRLYEEIGIGTRDQEMGGPQRDVTKLDGSFEQRSGLIGVDWNKGLTQLSHPVDGVVLLLAESGLKITAADDLADAAHKVVTAAREASAW